MFLSASVGGFIIVVVVVLMCHKQLYAPETSLMEFAFLASSGTISQHSTQTARIMQELGGDCCSYLSVAKVPTTSVGGFVSWQ